MIRIRSVVGNVLLGLLERAGMVPPDTREAREVDTLRKSRARLQTERQSFKVRPTVLMGDATRGEAACLLGVAWEVVALPGAGREHPTTGLYPGEAVPVTTELMAAVYAVPEDATTFECEEPRRDGAGDDIHVVSAMRVRVLGPKTPTTVRLRQVGHRSKDADGGTWWMRSKQGDDPYRIELPETAPYGGGPLRVELEWPE